MFKKLSILFALLVFALFAQSSFANACNKSSDRTKIVIENITVEGEEDSIINIVWKRSSCKTEQNLKNDFGRLELSKIDLQGRSSKVKVKQMNLFNLNDENARAIIVIPTAELKALGTLQVELIVGSYTQSTRAIIHLDFEFTDGVGEVYVENMISHDI